MRFSLFDWNAFLLEITLDYVMILNRIMPNNKLAETAKKLPLSPGVYQFMDRNKRILYIGRATSLRRRVLQYFQKNLESRIAEMVSQAQAIKFTKTDSVLEAIILEANLIKKHWPKYNVKDKDNRTFSYLVLALKDDYPKPLIVRERELEKFPADKNVKIFGPYQNATAIKNILRILRRFFPYSTCRPNNGQPCFDYQVGLCPGTCVGKITPTAYQKNIKSLVAFFEGRKKSLLKSLAKTNPELALGLKNINDVSLISKDEMSGFATEAKNRLEAYDISHFSGGETVGAMAVFKNGQPDKSSYRLFNIRSVKNNDLAALTEMISRRLNHAEWPWPDLFLIDGGRPQILAIEKLFKEKNISKPLIGLSKLAGDELVFAKNTSVNIKNLAKNIKITLQQARDEAHRFANTHRRRKMKLGQKTP